MTGRSKAHLNRKPIIYQRRLNRNQEEMKHESVSFQRRSDLETVLTLVFELCGQFPFLSSASAVRLEVCLVHAASTVHTKGRPRSLRCFEKKAIISSWHTICYNEKPSYNHLFLINVFICSSRRSRVLVKWSPVTQGELWLTSGSSRADNESHAVQFLHCINQDTFISLNVCSVTHVPVFNVFDFFSSLLKVQRWNVNIF